MGGRYPGPMALTGTMWLISTLGWPTTNHRAKLDFEGCKILSLREKLPDIFRSTADCYLCYLHGTTGTAESLSLRGEATARSEARGNVGSIVVPSPKLKKSGAGRRVQ